MKVLFFLIAIFLLSSCTGTEEISSPNLRIRNSSSKKVIIQCYINSILEINEEINPNAFGVKYPVSSASIGFGAFDSIIIKFSSNKGFICTKLENSICFPNRPSPLANDINDYLKEGNTYTYIITEEDYQNAFDL